MAAPRQFHLFPPPPIQNRINEPQNRKNSRRRPSIQKDESPVAQEEDTKASGQAEAVILQIIEDTNKAIPPRAESPTSIPGGAEAPKLLGYAQQQTGHTQKHIPEPIKQQPQQAVPNQSQYARPSQPASRSQSPFSNITERPGPHGPNCSTTMRSASAPLPWAAPGRPSSQASVRSGTMGPSRAQTPEAPMASMFPRYDPRLPLGQQRYYPQLSRTTNLPPDAVSRTERKTAAITRGLNERIAAQAETPNSFELASTEELVHLWNAANGERYQDGIGTVNLCLRRTDSLTYTLGNRFVPLYTLKTNRMNDIEIHRTHPGRQNTKAPVVTLSLGEIDQYNTENVTMTLFPKLAEICAREQALELSRRNRLDPPRAMQAENDAVRRAEAQEACVLRWNPAYSRYDLYHHAFTRDNDSQRSSASNMQSNDTASGMLSLTITTSTDAHGHPLQSSPSIIITSPQPPQTRPPSPLAFGNDTTIVALNLNTMTLSIATESILSATPSLYTLDALIATMLTVAVFDDASSLVLRDIAIHQTTPEDFPSPYRASTPIIESGRATPRRSDSTNTGASTHRYAPNDNPQQDHEGTNEGAGESKQEAALMTQIRSEQQRRSSTYRNSTEYSNYRRSFQPWKRAKLTLMGLRGAVPDENRAQTKEKALNHSGGRDSANTYSSYPTTISVKEIDVERNGGARQVGRANRSSFAGEDEKRPTLPSTAEKRPNFIVRILRALISAFMMILRFIKSLLVRGT